MPHSSKVMGDSRQPERRNSDEGVREIVKMAVHEVLSSLSIDSSTFEGRERFRANMAFLDDARTGTKAVKRTLWGGAATVIGLAVYKVWPALLLWLSR